MASTVRTGKTSPKSVAAPTPARFVHGTYPPSPSIAPVNIKPAKSPRRDYGKAQPLAQDPGSEGLM